MKNFLSDETTAAKNAWSSYHAGKKSVPTPTSLNSSILLLLKDVVHTSDKQHHLIELCIEYTNTLNPRETTAVHGSYQPTYAFSKIIKWKYPEFVFLKYFGNNLLTTKGHLVAGTGLDEIAGDTSVDKTGLKIATVDANHIHKDRYSVQQSVVLIYNFLKEVQEASNSVLPLFL